MQLLLTPLAGNRVNICIMVNNELRNHPGVSKSNLIENAVSFALRSGFQAEIVEDSRGISSIVSSEAFNPSLGVYLVGDSAEIFDPIGGMGMSHALVSASLAAESVNHAICNPKRSFKNWQKYLKHRRRYALIFSLYTKLSYTLNVRRAKVVKTLVRYFPSATEKIFRSLTNFSPVVGLARSITGSSLLNEVSK